MLRKAWEEYLGTKPGWKATFKDFMKGSEAHKYYMKHPNEALEASIEDATDTSDWVHAKGYWRATMFSDYVLHQPFQPFGDDLVIQQMQQAAISKNAHKYWVLVGAFGLAMYFQSKFNSGGSIRFGSFKSETKWLNQMNNRGWTMEQIYEAVAQGESSPVINKVHPGNEATLYYHPATGRGVVIDNVTNEVLHIGGDNFDYSDWLLK